MYVDHELKYIIFEDIMIFKPLNNLVKVFLYYAIYRLQHKSSSNYEWKGKGRKKRTKTRWKTISEGWRDEDGNEENEEETEDGVEGEKECSKYVGGV